MREFMIQEGSTTVNATIREVLDGEPTGRTIHIRHLPDEIFTREERACGHRIDQDSPRNSFAVTPVQFDTIEIAAVCCRLAKESLVRMHFDPNMDEVDRDKFIAPPFNIVLIHDGDDDSL